MEEPKTKGINGGPQKSRPNNKGFARGVAALLAVLAIAFCAWSMSEYIAGRDPLAFLGGAATSTAESDATPEEEAIEEDSESQATPGKKDAEDSAPANSATTDGEAKVSEQDEGHDAQEEGPSSDAPQVTAESQPAPIAEEDEPVAEAEPSPTPQPSPEPDPTPTPKPEDPSPEPDPTPDPKPEPAPAPDPEPEPTPGPEPAPEPEPVPEPAPEPATVTVTVTVDTGSGTSQATVTLDQGATALDALFATGVDVQTIANPFGGGSWVTSIGGVTEGGGRGWTYTVSGAMPGVMSDEYVLSDGDSVVWSFV